MIAEGQPRLSAASKAASRVRAPVKVVVAASALVLAVLDGLYARSLFGFPSWNVVDVALAAVVSALFVGSGLVAWLKRPDSRSGPLMILLGVVLFAEDFTFWPSWSLHLLGVWSDSLRVPLLAHLILTYPSGRMSSLPQRLVIGALYACAVAFAVAFNEGLSRPSVLLGVTVGMGVLGVGLALSTRWNTRRPDRPVPLAFAPASAIAVALLIASYGVLGFGGDGFRFTEPWLRAFAILGWIRSAILGVALALVTIRFVKASRPTRRALVPMWLSTFVLGLVTAFGAWIANSPHTFPNLVLVHDLTEWMTISIALVPLAFLWGLLRLHLVRGTVGELVVELGGTPRAGGLRDALARTLRDSSLQLAFCLPDGSYVDAEGKPFALPAAGSGRAVTVLEQGGEPLAAMVHDPALSNEPEAVEAAGAAARLALENERLHAEVKAQLEQVRASRARIVEAADEERRRVEQDLHDGAQQRLVSLSLAIRQARSQLQSDDPAADLTLAQADDELRLALSEIRELARGIHPAVLTEDGLAAALDSLTERSSVPARVIVAPVGRLPIPVEVTAYFVVSEALANVAKYAEASDVAITVSATDGRIVVEVVDDGVGGADLVKGRGLRGLEDRVLALDGRFTVESPPGHGTRIVAVIPCA